MGLGQNLIPDEVVIGHGWGITEEFRIHGRISEDQIGPIRAEKGYFAGLYYLRAAEGRIDACTGIEHEDISESLVEVIHISECGEVTIEVGPVVSYIWLAQGCR